MSLIDCPECKNKCSDQACICPKCGYPFRELDYEYQEIFINCTRSKTNYLEEMLAPYKAEGWRVEKITKKDEFKYYGYSTFSVIFKRIKRNV